MNLSPKLPEVADVEESLFELEAAQFNYDHALRALGRDLDNPLLRADFEEARTDLSDAQKVLTKAQAALDERAREFARLDAALGALSDVRELRQNMDEMGFGGDDFGLEKSA